MAGMSWDDFKNVYVDHWIKRAEADLRGAEKMFKSPIERVMYLLLQEERMGFPELHFEHQKKFGKYTVDFYLRYESEKGVLEMIIECDGHDFHERTKEQAAHDRKRDRYFTTKGFKVLRFTGSEIMSRPYELLRDMWNLILNHDEVL